MPITAADVQNTVTEVQAISDSILGVIEGAAPTLALPAEGAQALVDLFAKLINTGVMAWSASAGVPITPESVMALLPNQTPLTPPDA